MVLFENGRIREAFSDGSEMNIVFKKITGEGTTVYFYSDIYKKIQGVYTMRNTETMEWITESPKEEEVGKYIVETKSMAGNLRRLESFWNGKKWDFSNQTFVKYLKENGN